MEAVLDGGFWDRVIPALRETTDSIGSATSSFTALSGGFGGAATHILAARQLLKEVLPYTDPATYQEAVSNFAEQVTRYGAPASLDFHAFRLLKVIANDGTESLGTELYPRTSQNYRAVSDVEPFVCRTDDVSAATTFFRNAIARGEEGIVVKPEVTAAQSGSPCVPYIKVRAPDYLSLVYGYDYLAQGKKGRLIQRKKTGAKRALAIAEFTAGEEMIAIPRRAVGMQNGDYMRVVSRVLCDFRKEADLDPAL
jgi:hypothetical protein